jgi:hypothetical protein
MLILDLKGSGPIDIRAFVCITLKLYIIMLHSKYCNISAAPFTAKKTPELLGFKVLH